MKPERTFTQEEIDNFIINHIKGIQEDYLDCIKKGNNDEYVKSMYLGKALGYCNMSVVFGSNDIFETAHKIYDDMLEQF